MDDLLSSGNIIGIAALAGVGLALLKRHWYRWAQWVFGIAWFFAEAKIIRWMYTSDAEFWTRILVGGVLLVVVAIGFLWTISKVESDLRQSLSEVKSLSPVFEKLTDFEKAILRQIVLIGRSTKTLNAQEPTLISIAEKTGFLTRSFVGHYDLNPTVREPLQTLLASDRSSLVAAEPGIGLNVSVKSEGREIRIVRNNEIAGEKRRGLEGFLINFNPPVEGLGLEYMGHFEVAGDVPSVKDNEFLIGAEPRQQLEGFAIKLTGAAANKFQVLYSAHAPNFGDYDECSDGKFCGSRQRARSLDTLTVRVVPREHDAA